MKNPFTIGDAKWYSTQVTEDKLARFDSGLVHSVYSTFALGKDAEWACRLFVLEMLEPGEEGVGSFLSIRHLSPAPLGAKVRHKATLLSVKENVILCKFEVFAEQVKVAEGEQEQRIVNKARFDQLIQGIAKQINGRDIN